MIQTAHFWKIFFHGHQSCQNTSENKKTVVNGLLKVKVHGMGRLLINYLLTMIINIILIVSKILYRVNWYSLPDVNKKLYHKIIPSPCSTISNTTLYYILFIQYQRILSYSSSPFFYLLKILHNLPL